ncbi:MAG: DUF362 domain-containing protein [Sedimentisphaerales bacterium]|nr:DUF362 domain-containing protein [Sedimentisphaerales bacterium]
MNLRNLNGDSSNLKSRRAFLKSTVLISAGLLMRNQVIARAAGSILADSKKSRVSFITGSDRREMVYQALMPLKDEIEKGIQGKQIIIKPNFVGTRYPLCATHADAVRGLLDFLKPIYKEKIIIGESSAFEVTSNGYMNYGYLPLEKEYNVTLVDLNEHSTKPVWITDRNIRPAKIQVISEFLNPKNYFISITRLKTHDTVVATMGLKNILMASPVSQYNGRRYKRAVHAGGPRWLNYNLFLLAQLMRPQLTVIDALEGMQGNGPVRGFAVEHGVALAGTDVLAVDSIGAQLMNIPLDNIGYLTYCAEAGLGNVDKSKIEIIGGKDPKDYVKRYQLPDSIERQLEWKSDLMS